VHAKSLSMGHIHHFDEPHSRFSNDSFVRLTSGNAE
jgi:hypothetical protein